jgi:hypothetical protein
MLHGLRSGALSRSLQLHALQLHALQLHALQLHALQLHGKCSPDPVVTAAIATG